MRGRWFFDLDVSHSAPLVRRGSMPDSGHRTCWSGMSRRRASFSTQSNKVHKRRPAPTLSATCSHPSQSQFGCMTHTKRPPDKTHAKTLNRASVTRFAFCRAGSLHDALETLVSNKPPSPLFALHCSTAARTKSTGLWAPATKSSTNHDHWSFCLVTHRTPTVNLFTPGSARTVSLNAPELRKHLPRHSPKLDEPDFDQRSLPSSGNSFAGSALSWCSTLFIDRLLPVRCGTAVKRGLLAALPRHRLPYG